MASVVRLELETPPSGSGSLSARSSVVVPLSPSNLMMSPGARSAARNAAGSPPIGGGASRGGASSPGVYLQSLSRHQERQQQWAMHSPLTSPSGSPRDLFAPSTPRAQTANSADSGMGMSMSGGGGGGGGYGGSMGYGGGGLTSSASEQMDRSRSRLHSRADSRDGAYSPSSVIRAGGVYVVPKGGHTNKVRDMNMSSAALREDSFDHPNTRCTLENMDWIAGLANPPTAAQLQMAGREYKVGRSAGPDPYNVTGKNLWKDGTRAKIWIPVGPAGTVHDSLREDWVRSEPSSVQALSFPRSLSPYKRHPNRCSSPEKMHPAVLAPNTKRRSESIAHASMRDMQSLLRKRDLLTGASGTCPPPLMGGLAPRAQSPTFRGRTTNRHQDTKTR
mmetsp:Transcript_21828/g.54026  ORF Transcript_21828/g.54026 Transcript_21828/m.54026 type:complete len:390 (+) Transcript_21828:225-1394(+)|eukprot:CAMPEP_0197587254 /NCGR_PEP_ID=MMETSP1326-20131121/8935_1 /TAXON_ID=1155430 /ORGANISM="Genus nov. species nov., Strain RCC2288" /LENGTH=389 /DNA_ID=CAMNT_0043151959 /DNA_START=227 /DNA_END=1396 /DNA_ORIENTATION=+